MHDNLLSSVSPKRAKQNILCKNRAILELHREDVSILFLYIDIRAFYLLQASKWKIVIFRQRIIGSWYISSGRLSCKNLRNIMQNSTCYYKFWIFFYCNSNYTCQHREAFLKLPKTSLKNYSLLVKHLVETVLSMSFRVFERHQKPRLYGISTVS